MTNIQKIYQKDLFKFFSIINFQIDYGGMSYFYDKDKMINSKQYFFQLKILKQTVFQSYMLFEEK